MSQHKTDRQLPILVVEDEEAIRKGLCDVLAFHGYAPRGAERGDDGLDLALREPFALLILDVMLPGVNGFDICEQVRQASPQLPILMLTARGAEEDVLRGFRCGSDDYVTKPFSVQELMARIEALLRRSGALPVAEPEPEPFAFGGWEIDPVERAARRGDDRLELTRRETDILALLAQDARRIVSRRRLLHEVWGYANADKIETRTVDMHIAKLRKKLGAGAGGGRELLIETVRGEGYRYSG
jgi:two-component system response regulator RegX3